VQNSANTKIGEVHFQFSKVKERSVSTSFFHLYGERIPETLAFNEKLGLAEVAALMDQKGAKKKRQNAQSFSAYRGTILLSMYVEDVPKPVKVGVVIAALAFS
jgi:hypothetical protein